MRWSAAPRRQWRPWFAFFPLRWHGDRVIWLERIWVRWGGEWSVWCPWELQPNLPLPPPDHDAIPSAGGGSGKDTRDAIAGVRSRMAYRLDERFGWGPFPSGYASQNAYDAFDEIADQILAAPAAPPPGEVK